MVGVAALLGSHAADAADHYFNNSDVVGADCSKATPCTIGEINGKSFSAGDRLFFAGGQEFSGCIYLAADDKGTASNPIIIT